MWRACSIFLLIAGLFHPPPPIGAISDLPKLSAPWALFSALPTGQQKNTAVCCVCFPTNNLKPCHYQKSSSTVAFLPALDTTTWREYISAICSGLVVSSGPLSSRVRTSRGKRIEMPLFASTYATPGDR
jgi:hypothetical protein